MTTRKLFDNMPGARVSPNPLFGEMRAAVFSPCEAYRYLLVREWNPEKPPMFFVMLNPSTATEEVNDPTVERCQRRAMADPNVGAVIVLNCFAFRSTSPLLLYTHQDPIGPLNDAWILASIAAYERPTVVCGWGEHVDVRHHRALDVYRLIQQSGGVPMALGINMSGHPKHPLYCSYRKSPFMYDGPVERRRRNTASRT